MSPTNIQQAVAMSNNEDMEGDVDRIHGLQGTDENIEGHEARGNKGGSCGGTEKEREQIQREKGKKPDQHNTQSRHSNDKNKECDNLPIMTRGGQIETE
jgi:hypothetical protein